MIYMIRLLPLTTTIFLTSCFITPKDSKKSSNSTQWCYHQRYMLHLTQLTQYKVSGIVSYFSNQKKNFFFFFLHQENQDFYNLILTNLVGITELKIQAQPNVIKVDIKNQHYVMNSKYSEQIINNFFGIPISLNTLRQWILGLPGVATVFKLDKQCRLSDITYVQKGKTWKVEYDYDNRSKSPALPLNIKLTELNQHININLKIHSWIIK